jgi:two-component system nitrogen regulation sensor histidine kinase GlnL
MTDFSKHGSARRLPREGRNPEPQPPATATDLQPREVADPVGDRFFRHIVSNMRNGVIAIAADGRFAFANQVAYNTLDVSPSAEDACRPFTEVFRDQPDIVRVLASAFELNHLPNRAEMRLKRTGQVIGYTLSQILDDNGRMAGVTLFFKDLTRVEQLEERERLRDRLAALGEMAAAIAHELKNPLAGIEVMAGLLRRHVNGSSDVQSLLNDIISEAKMANAIVQEVLEFVRPIRLQVQHISIAQVLHDAIRLAESKGTRRKINVSVRVDEAVPLIQADHHQLCQVFTNLLVNAFEAMNGEGTVAITARAGIEDEHRGVVEMPGVMSSLVVDVCDDGPGVPADILDRIFNPFFTTKPQGSGLGLAIVRKIIDAHDGRIDVNPGPHGGTRFRVTIPLSEDRAWFERTGA